MERQCKQKGERACKPGSVLGRPFISNASRPAPLARNPSARRATVWRSYLRLLQMGFTKPRRCRRAGALLPHRFSFSPVSRMLRIAACSEQGSLLFCGTDPSGRPAQPLAGILPLGARTFLMLAHAIARLTRGGSIHRSSNDVYGRRCGPIGHLILLLQAALTGKARLAPAFKAI